MRRLEYSRSAEMRALAPVGKPLAVCRTAGISPVSGPISIASVLRRRQGDLRGALEMQ
jgi:hypothetical protein